MCFAAAAVLALSTCARIEYVEVKVPEYIYEYIFEYIDVPTPLIALNDNIITRVGGMEQMQKVSFYVSNVITMRLDSIEQEYTVVDDKVVRTSDIYANNVRIEPTYRGKLQSSPKRTAPSFGYQLNVVFENSEGRPSIPFVKQGYGAGERYVLLFSDAANQKIKVGSATYIVTFGGDEAPYLLFALTDNIYIH